MGDKITGRIKMWQGRYGFIYSDQALKPDIYFHVSEVRKANIRLPLRPEQAIRYRLGRTPDDRGMMAIDLELA